MSLLSYNIYLAYTHNKKTPVEDEKGSVPIFMDAAKIIVNNINEMTEVLPIISSLSHSLPLKSFFPILFILIFFQRPLFSILLTLL